MRKLINFLKYFAMFLMSFFLILGAGHFIEVSPENAEFDENCTDSVEIFVLDKGIHTAIITPYEAAGVDWSDFIEPDSINPYGEPPYEYIEFGWGEERFYINTPRWKDFRFRNVLPALFWPTSSVMHVAGFRRAPVRGDMVAINVNECAYREMADFIKSTFYKKDGQLEYIAEGYGRHDGFFKAEGRYHLFRNCNNWAADALEIAGQSTPLLPVFSSSVMRHIEH